MLEDAPPREAAPVGRTKGAVVLTGQPHWCTELAVGLCRYGGLETELATLGGLLSALDPRVWWRIAHARVVLVVGFRPGATTIRGKLFDTLFGLTRRIGPQKSILRYWIGSDVQHALGDLARGRDRKRFARLIADDVHLAGSPALAQDLEALDVHATVVDFPWLGMPRDARPLPMPVKFTVLTYVPDARAAFYGGPELIQAALALPQIRFHVVGGVGTWIANHPENVRFLGWRNDMEACYAAASCVVRMVRYDSVGATVIEALAYGRTALYSQSLMHTTHVPFGDVDCLIRSLQELEEQYRGELTPPDRAASEWALREYDAGRLFDVLAKRLRSAIGSRATGDSQA